MRPTRIVSLVVGVLTGLGMLALAIYLFWIQRPHHEFWFYWIGPFLAVGLGGMMINLVAQYWLRVGRLEVRGRPKE